MFCNNCGNKIDDDALFCPECGTKLIETDKKSTEAAQFENMVKTEKETDYIEQYNKKQASKKATVKSFVCLGAIIAIVAIAVGGFLSTPFGKNFGKYIVASQYASEGNYGRAYNTISDTTDTKANYFKDYCLLMYSVENLNIVEEDPNPSISFDEDGGMITVTSGSSGGTPIGEEENVDIQNSIEYPIVNFEDFKFYSEEVLPSEFYPNIGQQTVEEGTLAQNDENKAMEYIRSNIGFVIDILYSKEEIFDDIINIKKCIYIAENSDSDIDSYIDCLSDSNGLFDELENLKNGKRFIPNKELELFKVYDESIGVALSEYQKYSSNAFRGFENYKKLIASYMHDMQEDIEGEKGNAIMYYTKMDYEDTSFDMGIMKNDIQLLIFKKYI